MVGVKLCNGAQQPRLADAAGPADEQHLALVQVKAEACEDWRAAHGQLSDTQRHAVNSWRVERGAQASAAEHGPWVVPKACKDTRGEGKLS